VSAQVSLLFRGEVPWFLEGGLQDETEEDDTHRQEGHEGQNVTKAVSESHNQVGDASELSQQLDE